MKAGSGGGATAAGTIETIMHSPLSEGDLVGGRKKVFSTARKTCFALLTCVLAISGLEFILEGLPVLWREEFRYNFKLDPAQPWCGRSTIYFWWLRPFEETTGVTGTSIPMGINAQHFRRAGLVADPKPEGRLRVVCMGDAVTFGWHLPPEDSYPAILERLLRERALGDIEVVNAGVPGYSSLQGLRFLRMEVTGLDPDIVLAHFGASDNTRAIVPDQARAKLLQLSDWFERLATFRVLETLTVRVRERLPDAIIRKLRRTAIRVDLESYVANLSSMVQWSQMERFKLIAIPPIGPAETGFRVLCPPASKRASGSRARARLEELWRLGPPIELSGALRSCGIPLERLHLPDEPGQLSREGNRVLAEEIFRALAEAGWIRLKP